MVSLDIISWRAMRDQQIIERTNYLHILYFFRPDKRQSSPEVRLRRRRDGFPVVAWYLCRTTKRKSHTIASVARIILSMGLANERRRYHVTPSLIGPYLGRPLRCYRELKVIFYQRQRTDRKYFLSIKRNWITGLSELWSVQYGVGTLERIPLEK